MFTAYLLTATISGPIYGKLSDLYGRRPIFIWALGLFLVASIGAGLSNQMWEFILFRGLQGLGGGAVFPIALAVVADLYPPQERAKYGALFGAVFVALLPVAISQARDLVPAWASSLVSPFGKDAGSAAFLAVDQFVKKPGIEPGLFGLILVLFILFEPLGIYGRWRKIQLYFSTFPLYKRATFRRQKAYMRSERLR